MVAEVVPDATVVALADTAAPVAETPPDESQPETFLETAAPETELVATPETEQDARSWREHIASVSEDELLEDDRIKSIVARREESSRRKTERELQLKAGSDQQVQSVLSYLMQRLDSGEITPQQFQQTAAQAVQAAKFYASVEMGRQLPEVLLGNYKIPVEFRERAVEARLEDNGSLDRYTRILLEGAVEASRGTTRYKDIPEGSALHKDVQAEVTRRVEAELKASQVASQPKRETPPSTPRGANAGSSPLPNPRTLSNEEYEGYSVEQRRAMWAAHPNG